MERPAPDDSYILVVDDNEETCQALSRLLRQPTVEPFGNIKVDRHAREGVVVAEVREPAVDVLEESDHLLIVAEMPGVGAADVKLEVHDDVLTLSAAAGDKKYRKEVLLPKSCPRERMTLSCNNGIVRIRCALD